MSADPSSSSQCQLKAAITFAEDGQPQRDPTLTIGPDVDGIPFDPAPAYDLEPTGFADSDLAKSIFVTDLNVFSLFSVKATRRRRIISEAAEARTSIARVREVQRTFRPRDPQLSPDFLMRVAASARSISDLDKRTTRIAVLEISVAVLICLTAGGWLGIFGSEVIFHSWWPSWTVVVAAIWVVRLLADAPYGPHVARTILFITMSIVFAYVLVFSTIARVALPATTPELIKWLALIGGEVNGLALSPPATLLPAKTLRRAPC